MSLLFSSSFSKKCENLLRVINIYYDWKASVMNTCRYSPAYGTEKHKICSVMIVILQDDRVEVIWSNLFVSTLLSHDVAFFDNDVHVVKAYTTHRTHFPATWLITAKCGNWGKSIRFVALSVGFFILIEQNLNKLTSAPFPWIFRAGSFVMRYLKRIEKLNQAISCSRCFWSRHTS